MKSLLIKSGQGDYSVEFTENLKLLAQNLLQIPNAVVAIDRNVAELHASSLSTLLDRLPTVLIDATEEEKSLTGVIKVLDFLQKSNCTRQSNLIVIGGGITQDIAAFTSHIYYRGLKWFFVPTTLLAMSDSCIGAKCGVNFNKFKNQLGVFHSPAKIFISMEFLNTLTDNDIRSGYGEILKLLLTGSPDFFGKLQTTINESGFRNPDLAELVYQSLSVKKEVIEIDEYETDLRRILNYGHTFGHALETLANYEIPHGLAIAWGMDLVNWIACKRNLLSETDFKMIHGFIAQYFQFQISKTLTATDLIQGAQRDKKVADGKISLILLERPGSLKIVPTVFDDSLSENITEYLDNYNVISSS